MRRIDAALVMLALAEGRAYQPVQIQKAMFLANDRARKVFDEGEKYNFKPYDYGPFDRDVYGDIELLELAGLAEIDRSGRWYKYSATDNGVAAAQPLIQAIEPETVALLRKISSVVRSLSFRDLVSAIYKAYPDMKENSVFVE